MSQALSSASSHGDWRLLFLQRDWIAATTADDVNRVAKMYFQQPNRTVGVYIPTQQADAALGSRRAVHCGCRQGLQGWRGRRGRRSLRPHACQPRQADEDHRRRQLQGGPLGQEESRLYRRARADLALRQRRFAQRSHDGRRHASRTDDGRHEKARPPGLARGA